MLPSTLLAAQCHRIVRVPQDTQDASGASLRHVGHGRISLAAQQALEHHTKLHAICAATAAATNMADLPPAKWGKSSRERGGADDALLQAPFAFGQRPQVFLPR